MNIIAIYHEDIIRILKTYTDWSFEQCNRVRMGIFKKDPAITESVAELRNKASAQVVKLIEEESHEAFCFPHIVAFSQFTKKTAILMTPHREIY